MKLLFDGFWWIEGPAANRTVMRELVLQWRRQFPEDHLVLAIRKTHLARADDVPEGIDLVPTRGWPHAASNVFELPRLASRCGADVTVVHNYAPLTGRSVVFIHDLLFLEHPEWFSAAERAYFRPMSWTSRRATAVVTSSRAEAERIERLAPELAPVAPIGLAVASELVTAEASRPASAPVTDYALVVGRLNARKNLESAILGAGRSGTITPDYPLLVVGDTAHSGRSASLPPQVQSLIEQGTVQFVGRVTDGELKWLYQHAGATVCVSLDEGFGLPPLEAVSFGSPLVASDIPPFRETVGGLARLVDPHDVGGIAAAIDSICRSRRYPNEAPSTKLTDYSWERTVAHLRQIAHDSIGAARDA